MAQRPILLAIVGDSAAGKSTLTAGLVKVLGPERVTRVCTDDYHKYDRRERSQLKITPLDPECNYLDILELHLERLHYGQPILKPVYDHATGTFVRPQYVSPGQFVIVEGLLGFHSAVMRQFYDVKVYLDPPEELRRFWKMRRDTTKRGYTPEQVEAELARREPDSRDYIRPQREFADMIVRFSPPAGATPETADGHLDARLTLRPTIPHPDLSYLFDDSRQDTSVRLSLGRDCGRPVDILEVDGKVSAEEAAELERKIWQHMRELPPVKAEDFGQYQDRAETRHSDPLALTQLFLTYHLLRKFSEGGKMLFAPPVAAMSRIRSAPTSAIGRNLEIDKSHTPK
jgi:phosphoribulokinase